MRIKTFRNASYVFFRVDITAIIDGEMKVPSRLRRF